METEHHRRRKLAELQTSIDSATLQTPTTSALLRSAHDQRHPMGRVRDWMLDFGILGAMTGLAAAVTHILSGGLTLSAGWSILMVTPLLLGLAATLAGAVAGGALRALRGKVSAVVGVLIAGMGVNFVGSMITLALPWDRLATASIIAGKAGPLSLAVLLLIPVVAVLRWREQSTLPWLVLAGALAGMLIGLS